MTTHTIYGIRTTGDVTDGTLSYAGSAKYRFVVPENFLFSFSYLNGAAVNVFGTPEIEDISNYGSNGSGTLVGAAEVEEAYFYALNFIDGTSMHLFELYEEESDSTYLFPIGGTRTDIPTSQAELDALVSDINSSNPSDLFIRRANDSPGDWANSATTENDRIFDTLGASSTFNGGPGDDEIYVFDGDDEVFGGAGNDRIVASGPGTNEFYGQSGNDVLKFKGVATGEISGGPGNDRIIGGDLGDELEGGSGSDTIIGLGGNDLIEGDTGNDFLYGGRDNDTVIGGEGDDVVRGNRNNDILRGEEGTDRLFGGGNNDQLFGDEDRDFLVGENGNDRLDGGEGDDNLTGGAGRDIFVFATDGDFDRILDFENGLDRIDVSGTSANSLGDISISSAGGGTDTRLGFGSGDTLYLFNTATSDINAADFIF